MNERRKLKRRYLSYYMPVINPATQEIMGHLVDITKKGIMMDSQKQLPPDKNFRLRLNVTSDVANKEYIEFVARSKWCRPDAIEPYLYDIGFEIVTISLEDDEIVQRIVEKYGTRDSISFL